MFENFQNIPTEYTPNNFRTCNNTGNSNLMPANPNKPYELKNIAGEVVGYYWWYGNSVNLTFETYCHCEPVLTLAWQSPKERHNAILCIYLVE